MSDSERTLDDAVLARLEDQIAIDDVLTRLEAQVAREREATDALLARLLRPEQHARLEKQLSRYRALSDLTKPKWKTGGG